MSGHDSTAAARPSSSSPVRFLGGYIRYTSMEASVRRLADLIIFPVSRGLAAGLDLDIGSVNVGVGVQHNVYLRDDGRPVYQTGLGISTTQAAPGILRARTSLVPHLVIDNGNVRAGLGLSTQDGIELRTNFGSDSDFRFLNWFGLELSLSQFHSLSANDPSQATIQAGINLGERPVGSESFIAHIVNAVGHTSGLMRWSELQQAVGDVPGLRIDNLDLKLSIFTGLDGALATRDLVRAGYMMRQAPAVISGAVLTVAGSLFLGGGLISHDLPLFNTGVVSAESGAQLMCRIFDGNRNSTEQAACRAVVAGGFSVAGLILLGSHSNDSLRPFAVNLSAIPAAGYVLTF